MRRGRGCGLAIRNVRSGLDAAAEHEGDGLRPVGDADTIDLIDFCGDKSRTSDRTGFYALTNDVSAADLKGCTLEYVTSSSGKAKGCLRLRAGKAVKGLMILLK